MTRALRRRIGSVATARETSIPAPVNGWNAQDPVAGMKPADAYTLENWICRPGYVELRKGHVGHVTGFASAVESLLPYRTGSNESLFACAGTSIYDVTSSGALGAAVVTGLTNARWEAVNFANDAGVWLVAFNGADTPLTYNGSAWSTSSISATVGSISMTGADIINAMMHKRRLFLQEANSLRVWYLAVNAISGTPGLLDLGPVFAEGGNLIAMGVWSAAGANSDATATAVFVTDQGEAAVYAGDDPSDATAWTLVGVYQIGKPLGPRAVLRTASDLIIVTYDGAIPMSLALQADRDKQKSKAITSSIQNEFSKAATAYGDKFGWQAIIYPTGQLAMINVPITELGRAKQFVQSSQTGKWSQFSGINATCWAYIDGAIYFGGQDGAGVKGVYRWDTGGSDNGTSIQADCITAFQHFGTPGRIKNFSQIRPILRAPASVMPYVDMLVDYKITQPTNIPDSGNVSTDGLWGEGLWGEATWTSSKPLRLDWTTAGGDGFVGAVRVRVIANPAQVSGVYPSVRCEIIGFDVIYETGDVFG